MDDYVHMQLVFLSSLAIVAYSDSQRSHGKFRPTLKALVQQNTDSTSKEQTADAFQTFTVASKADIKPQEGIKILTNLRGVGPATASLLASVFEPATIPFFSDELFRWCFFGDGKGNGWDRDIKYNMKEYLQLFDEVQAFRRRFYEDFEREVSAVEMEKVAYVLGKKVAPVSAGGDGKKGKAETNPKGEVQDDPLASVKSDLTLAKGKGAAEEKGAKQKKPVETRSSESKTIPDSRKAQKTAIEATAAASRPRRNAK